MSDEDGDVISPRDLADVEEAMTMPPPDMSPARYADALRAMVDRTCDQLTTSYLAYARSGGPLPNDFREDRCMLVTAMETVLRAASQHADELAESGDDVNARRLQNAVTYCSMRICFL